MHFPILILSTRTRGLRWTLTFKGRHGLQDAKLLENRHEEDDDHTDGEQFHALDPHDSWLGVGGWGGGGFSGPSLRETWPGEGAEGRSRPGRVNPGAGESTSVERRESGFSLTRA